MTNYDTFNKIQILHLIETVLLKIKWQLFFVCNFFGSLLDFE